MDISINTAHNVGIEYKPAGLIERIFATMIDFLMMGGIILFVVMISSKSLLQNSVFIVSLITILSCYHLLFELCMDGKSPGKMALHLQVVRLDGNKLIFWDYLLRWILRLIDITICLGIVAITSIIVTQKMQRLGDIASGTIVIRKKTAATLQQLGTYATSDNYQIVFPQANLLADKDIVIIKEVLAEVEKNMEYRLLQPLVLKIKELTGIQTTMDNLRFVQTILHDYNHITKQ